MGPDKGRYQAIALSLSLCCYVSRSFVHLQENQHCRRSKEPGHINHLETTTPKRVLWQTVENQLKCRIMRHFTRVFTVCLDKIDIQRKKYNFFLKKKYKMWPLSYTLDNPDFIACSFVENANGSGWDLLNQKHNIVCLLGYMK